MKKLNRRKFVFMSFTGFTAAIAVLWFFKVPILKNFVFKSNFDPSLLKNAPSEIDDFCVLTTQQEEGPYFFPSPERVNIIEDRQGQELNIKLQVLKYPECKPIEGAIVDIWHCDAEGTYSGYPEEITHDIWKTVLFIGMNGKKRDNQMHVDPVDENKFLRGMQRSDKNGWVNFKTIFPGWYEGRAPHIHTKVTLNEKEHVFTQFYFDEDICNNIYTTQAPYNKYGVCPVKTKEDIVLSSNDSANGLKLNINSNNANILSASAKIGISSPA